MFQFLGQDVDNGVDDGGLLEGSQSSPHGERGVVAMRGPPGG